MVRTLALTAAALALTACEDYQKPIGFTPHGDSVRHNLAAQIIDPRPPEHRPDLSGAVRPALSVETYNKNEVKNPAPEGSSAKTTDAAN